MIKEPELEAYLFQGEVVAIYPEARLIDVKWRNANSVKRKVMVVQDAGTYSFPRIGEIGLVIGNDHTRYYYLGKIDFSYSTKLDGTQKNPDTGNKWNARLIDAGETYLANIANGIGLLMANAGDFSLTNLFQDGLKYIRDKAGEPLRWLTVAAKAVQVTSKTSFINVGAVLRQIPILGTKIVKDQTKTKAAQEILAKVTNVVGVEPLDKAKMHLGDIFIEPIVSGDAAIPQPHTELGPSGLANKVRAVLAAFNDLGIEGGSIKMDDKGNVSINAVIAAGGGMMAITGTKIAVGGDVDTTIQPAVFGTLLTTWLGQHRHLDSMGGTGVPTAEDIANLPGLVSKKVFIG